MQDIHFFKSGKHTSASGAEVSFSEADIHQIAESYDPKIHEAPIVVGHPKDNGPAFGWVENISVLNDGLHAVPRQVHPEFHELVKAGTYKKVSASFYPKDHPNNPKPGQWYLRHIGFLGAAAPAVKGLNGVNFAETDDFVFAEIDMLSLREYAVQRREQQLKRSELETSVRKASKEGRLPIGLLDGALAFAESLGTNQAFEFNEGDGIIQSSQQTWFLDFLARLPVPVVAKELAVGEMDFADSDFVAPKGYKTDNFGSEIDRIATSHMKANGGSYSDAVRFAEKNIRR